MNSPANGAEATGVVAAVTAAAEGHISSAEAVRQVTPAEVERLLHAGLVAPATPVTSGVGASPGAAAGVACFSLEQVFQAVEADQAAIYVRPFTTPADEPAMQCAAGILTAGGGVASHAAVVARGWGIPAVVGVEGLHVDDTSGTARLEGTELRAGDPITVDGSSGDVILGYSEIRDGDTSTEALGALHTLLGWADELRGTRLGVWANADDAAAASVALENGAEGIGLCRTEHLFMGDRLALLQRAILEASAAAMEELVHAQTESLVELLGVADGVPVVVRLLDPPLHEFLPGHPELAEHNPMLGVRGARLGVQTSELYQAQARAVAAAVARREAAGGSPQVKIMVPLVVSGAELAYVRRLIVKAMDGCVVPVGAMLETPRAALCSAELAAHADFFSFGTNDLTQMTFGFSRDDVEAKIMRTYLEQGLLSANPFETLDPEGVGALVRTATRSVREAGLDTEIGVCGEHGGDPESIAFLAEVGVDYVSCSPYRVPVARLAAAQAVMRAD